MKSRVRTITPSLTSQGRPCLLEITLYTHTPCKSVYRYCIPLPSILTTWFCDQQEKMTTGATVMLLKEGPGKPVPPPYTDKNRDAGSNLIQVPACRELQVPASEGTQ